MVYFCDVTEVWSPNNSMMEIFLRLGNRVKLNRLLEESTQNTILKIVYNLESNITPINKHAPTIIRSNIQF